MPCSFRSRPWHSISVPALLLLAFCLGLGPVAADDGLPAEPPAGDERIAKQVVSQLERNHFHQRRLDDEISRRCFDRYLESLDPSKTHFLQSDFDEFAANRTEIDDMVKSGDLSLAYKVYHRFLARSDERIEAIHRFIDAEHDYTVDETLVVEADSLGYPKDIDEANERLRKQIKYNLLISMVEEREEQDRAAKAEASRLAGEGPVVIPADFVGPPAPGVEFTDDPAEDDDVEAPLPDDPRSRLHRRYNARHRSIRQLDRYELLELFLTTLTSSYDPHSTYWSQKTLDWFEIQMRLKLEGIGAELRMSDEGYTTVSRVVPGGAADRDGRLAPGDRIVGVGSGKEGPIVDVVGMKLSDVVPQIRGESGSIVRLEVLPVGKRKKRLYELTRAEVKLEEQAARGEVFEHGKRADGMPYVVGVIELPSFYRDMTAAEQGQMNFTSTTKDVAKILESFLNRKVDAVVLDLRQNGGGALNEAIDLTGLFIDSGPVVQVRDQRVMTHDDEIKGVLWGGPLVVLTSRESASASEIFAGAIQDYRRGLVVGDPATHGKGTVQKLNPVNGGMGAVKLTTQKFYRVTGASTQVQGVEADVVLPSVRSILEGESADEYALPFDRIEGLPFKVYDYVTPELIQKLRESSGKRVMESPEFQRTQRFLATYLKYKDRQEVPLNEQKYLAERAETQADSPEEESSAGSTTILGYDPDEVAVEVADPDGDPADGNGDAKPAADEGIKLDYYLKEALAVTVDYIELRPWTGGKDAM